MIKLDLENDVSNGLSIKKISKKYEKSQATICYWLKKFGLKTKHLFVSPNKENYDKYGSIYEKFDWNKCQVLYDTGLTCKELISFGFPVNATLWASRNKRIKLRSRYESMKISHRMGKVCYDSFRTEKFRKQMSKYGGYKEHSGKCKWISYINKKGKSINLQGTWELKMAKFLDDKNINWDKNKIGYKYHFNGKEYNYFPDFVLPDLNIFIEVKGYEREKDKEKWSQFPMKLLIVKKKEISDLNKWWKNINII